MFLIIKIGQLFTSKTTKIKKKIVKNNNFLRFHARFFKVSDFFCSRRGDRFLDATPHPCPCVRVLIIYNLFVNTSAHHRKYGHMILYHFRPAARKKSGMMRTITWRAWCVTTHNWSQPRFTHKALWFTVCVTTKTNQQKNNCFWFLKTRWVGAFPFTVGDCDSVTLS